MKLFKKIPKIAAFIFFVNLSIAVFSQTGHISYSVSQLALSVITSISDAEPVCEGSIIKFIVGTTGDSLTFQWYHNGIVISNSNNDTLILSNVSIIDAGSYFCIASNCAGSDTSNNANLFVFATGVTITDTINKFIHDGRDCQSYPIVKIGNQWWMAENLKTKKYRNGDNITNGTGSGNISGITNPKYWFVYNDDAVNEDTYGLMYTWHALTDNRHICATGWHETKNNEWQELFNFLGGDSVAGAKMKETGTIHWNAPNTNATNESGFTALPAGARGNNGTFANLGASGRFWSGSEYNSTNAWRYELTSSSNAVINANGNKSNGFSVRCLINNCSDILVNNSISICQGQSYSVGTHTYNTNGIYIDTINLASGCDSIITTNLTVFSNPSVSLGNDSSVCGSITLNASASGGTPPFNYIWNSACTYASCSVSISGIYSVSLADSAGCTATDTINVTLWSVPVVNISGINSVCQGTSIIMSSTVTGGTAPLLYNWSPGYSVMNTYTITPQQSAQYFLTVTDAHQCSGFAYLNITVYPLPVTSAITGAATANPDDVKSYFVENHTGSIYSWSVTGGYIVNGQSSNLINIYWQTQGVGTVCVSESDQYGCNSVTVCMQISVGFTCTGLNVTVQGNNPTCFNNCNGFINTTVSGGTQPYTYIWNDAQHQTGNMAINLCEGYFTVTVHDKFQCTAMATVNIVSPMEITIFVSTSDADCGSDNGYAIATVTAGTPPYNYAWTNGDTLMNANNLASGLYMLTVTDNAGCSEFTLVTINDQDGPVFNIDSVIDLNCNQSHDGAIDISVTGGSTPYIYNWSDGAITQDISGLEAGPYEIQVSDTNGCTASILISVQQPAPLTVNVTTTESNCGTADGTASVNISGGTAPYTFLWNTGGNSQNPINMPAGVYYVSITDSHGCTNNNGTMVAINNSSGPQIAIDSIISASCNGSDGAVYITTSGGAAPYQFNWTDSTATEDLTGIEIGDYSITVTDNNGCIGTGMATVYPVLQATPQICMVLVDSTLTKNLIIWEKEVTTGINHYNIYREGSWAGSYFLIGTRNYSELSTFMDQTSFPMNRSYRYRITSVDQCNNESQTSNPHKTMFLAINEGIGNNWNLQWSDYEGFSFPGYYIWRHNQPLGWVLLDSIATGYNFYSDNPPNQSQLKYLVTVRAPYICNPSTGKEMTGPFSQSLSNIEDNGIILSAKNISSDFSVELFPNPTKNKVFIKSAKNLRIKVYNILGELIYDGNTNESNYVILHLKGIFIFELSYGKNIINKKVVVQ